MDKQQKGFTLLEILVVLGIIAILAAIVIVATSPARHLAAARDTVRTNDLHQLVNAVYEYALDNNGQFPPSISTTPADVGTSGLNLAEFLVPVYLSRIPEDPVSGSKSITQYVMFREGHKLVSSATGELQETITVVR